MAEHCGKTEEHFDESDDGAEDQGFDLAALVDNGEQDDEQVSTALAESLAQRRAALVSQQQADQNSAAAAMQDARARQRSALPDLYDESYVACDALPTERVPMSCADVVAQTRGKASSRPNKFILPVDFTSERPQRGGGNRIDYALTSRPKGAKAVRADPNDTICHLCEGDGALMLCDGPCRRSFHRACYDKYQGRFLPAPDKLFQADDSAHESVPIQTESCDVDAPAQDQSAAAADATNSETWCCTDCTYQSQVCAICHQRGDVSYGEDNMELQRCKINLCGRYIHPACMRRLRSALPERMQKSIVDNKCTHHSCLTCGEGHRTGSGVLKCVRCYAAYHANCTPPGSLFLLRPFFLCPKHPQPKPTSAVEHAYNDKRQKELMNTFRRIPPISVFSGEFTGTWVTTSSYLAKRPFQLSRVLAQAGREVMNSQPPPYVSLVRNTYLIRPYVDREQAESVCSCTPASKCDQRCVNRAMLIECNPSKCPAGAECTNRRIQERQYPPLKLFKTESRGWGVKCPRDLEANELVIEYCGEVIDQEESDRRLAEMKLRGETNFYLFAVSPSHIIDAGQKGNLARFLNHACNPNCYSQRWSVNGRVRVGLFAKTHIAAGVELTYDYNFQGFWPPGEEQACKCGSDNCGLILGKRPKSAKLMKEEQEKLKMAKKKRASNTGESASKKAKTESSEVSTASTDVAQTESGAPAQEPAV